MKSRRVGARDLDTLSDEELLECRLSDLHITQAEPLIHDRVTRLHHELAGKGINFKPHVWLSDGWFSPDGVPGIAIPFYLAHPRLMKLEKRMMLEVDGSSEAAFMRVLRHEAGHAIDTAFRLHFRRGWQQIFGSFAAPYPKFYRPKANSRRFVQHLDDWYAQAHPAEDFAETFAVWLRPGSSWRSVYQGWPALKKLEYVDSVMNELRGQRALVSVRRKVDPVSKLRLTLQQYYEEKQRYYAVHVPPVFDWHLFKIFGDDPRFERNLTAVTFFRKHRQELRTLVADWTSTSQYTIDQLLDEIVERCKSLKLRLTQSERQTKHQVMMMLAVQTMRFALSGQLQMKM